MLNPVVSYFRILHNQEPATIELTGAYPDESPTHHVYKLTAGDIESIIVAEQTQLSLIIREVTDPQELLAIKALQVGQGPSSPTKGVTTI